MNRTMAMCLGGAMALFAIAAAAEPPASTPVGDIGAGGPCESIGEVVGLKAGRDGFLAVREGPGTGHAQVGSLGDGRRVRLCRSEGRWVSVMFPPPGSGMRCEPDSADIRRYRGPCQSGWVHWNWIRIVAG
ncbi:SH3 domain-containing protein [Lysobacter enzymogenes]|uniref:SH3 domain-containing protein n=1 Tax=Lysobacter enzymogenes TaxID=69 RepID=UPI001A975397|nr:SH3 domain-containing protein [Lysobacter enzymogenes]QQP97863.1 SH3 domain-containing protein [Lysobacter enzymogenes]